MPGASDLVFYAVLATLLGAAGLAWERRRRSRALQRLAREKALTSGLLEEAEASATSRIRELLERNGAPVTIRQSAGRPEEIGEEIHP